MATVSQCAECKATLAEPPDVPADKRKPCPECGSTRRVISASGGLVVGVNITVGAPAATASAGTGSPTVSIGEALENAGFDLQWLRLSEGGAWLVRVFDRRGDFIDGAMADNPEDALLSVADRLLPSK